MVEKFDDKEVAVFLRDEIPVAFEHESHIIGMDVLDAFGENQILTRSEIEERLVDEGERSKRIALEALDEYYRRRNEK